MRGTLLVVDMFIHIHNHTTKIRLPNVEDEFDFIILFPSLNTFITKIEKKKEKKKEEGHILSIF